MRVRLLTLALLLLAPMQASAEWQIRPFLGVTFGGNTTFVDLEHAAGNANVIFGVNGALVGELIGVEGDLEHAPGFFQSGDQHLVVRSSATTLTGNLVVAVPRHLTQYTLRPYVVGGGGLMHVEIVDWFNAFSIAETLPAMDVGGGVTGFLTKRIGLSWEVRRFWSLQGHEVVGLSFGAEQLSFWRANMALAIRY